MKVKKLLALVLVFCMNLSLFPTSTAAAAAPAVSNNQSRQDYTVYSQAVTSYLYKNEVGGLTRVEYIDGQVIVEDYDTSFNLKFSSTLSPELPIWGGFYAGEDYNFLIYGQKNQNQSDSMEVLRVVKYDQDWNRLGAASLYGANTTIPLNNGSLRCTEHSGYLYIHTCHEMYTSDDGLNHQANLTLCVRQKDMVITDSAHDVRAVDQGYVSHSFNQFVIVDQKGHLVTLDHGDGSPRSASLMRYDGNLVGTFGVRIDLMAFPGNIGQNETGASLGGLTETKNCYIAALNYSSDKERIPYFFCLEKTTGNEWTLNINKLTDQAGASTPVLAPVDLNGGYVLWGDKRSNAVNGTLYYRSYDANGTLGEPKAALAPLSDCQPIPYKDGVVWYTTSNSAPIFYVLNSQGVKAYAAVEGQTVPDQSKAPAPAPAAKIPTPIPDPDPDDVPAEDLLSGSMPVSVLSAGFSCAVIDTDGSLWTWGRNTHGQLGNGTTKDSAVPVKVMEDVVAVSCNASRTAAIKTDDSLWVWGGDIEISKDSVVPVKVMEDVIAVSCGESHTAVIKADRSLWTWGSNVKGQLGNGTTKPSTVPVKVMEDVAFVSCGLSHTAAIKTDGSLWTWGEGLDGQLGTGTTDGSTVPVRVMENVVATTAGRYNTMALRSDGTLWAWGRNEYGELGNGGDGNIGATISGNLYYCETNPVQVLDRVVSISSGNPAAIREDGTLWVWGRGVPGLMENSLTAESVFPVKVMEDAAVVSKDGLSGAVIKTDGSIWCWGLNEYGQLGNGTSGLTPDGRVLWESDPTKIDGLIAKVPQLPTLSEPVPATGTAYTSTQTVSIDGKPVTLEAYALKDSNGNPTNYVKLRDVAYVLNGTAAQFEVAWDGNVNIATGKSYTANGSEMSTPFSGNRTYAIPTAQTNINGAAADLAAISLTDDSGGGFTYYQLRDLGRALDFNVGWSSERGIFIETDKPYTDAN